MQVSNVQLHLKKRTPKLEIYEVYDIETEERVGTFNRVEFKNEVFLSIVNNEKEGRLLRTNLLREGAAAIYMFAGFKWLLPPS